MGRTASAALRLQESDLAIFESLRQVRHLTTAQLAEEFGRQRWSINRRLIRLEEAGYVSRTRTGQTEDDIWHPTNRAITALVKAGNLKPGQSTWTAKQAQSGVIHQQHETDANKLRLAWLRWADEHDVVVETCLDTRQFDQTVRERDGRRYYVRPDRFLHLRIASRSFYFLIEVDRGTKALETSKRNWQDVAGQLYGYVPYYRQGCFAKIMAKQRGSTEVQPQRWPFRVLVTVESRKDSPVVHRTNMMAKVIKRMQQHRCNPPVSGSRGYALFTEAVADPYAKIWLREVELYRILKWLEKLDVGRPLAQCLPTDARYDPVREALPADILERAYKYWPKRSGRGKKKPLRDTKVRDALIETLIAVKSLVRYSVLEEWPKPAKRQ